MQDLETKKLLDQVTNTLHRSSEISELWVGTLRQKILDEQSAQLLDAVHRNDLDSAKNFLVNLDSFLIVQEDVYS